MRKPEVRVSQKDLAAALGVSDRRVRQMETEFILPPPRDGGYDLAVCRERYRLYRSGTDREWHDFLEGTHDVGERTQQLVDAIEAPGAAEAEVRAASLAIQDMFAMARFITACRSSTGAERAFVMPLWAREENDALRIVVSRYIEIVAAREGVTPEDVRAHLRAEEQAGGAQEVAA